MPDLDSVQLLRDAVNRLVAFDGTLQPHPTYGRCTKEQVASLQTLHLHEHLPGVERPEAVAAGTHAADVGPVGSHATDVDPVGTHAAGADQVGTHATDVGPVGTHTSAAADAHSGSAAATPFSPAVEPTR